MGNGTIYFQVGSQLKTTLRELFGTWRDKSIHGPLESLEHGDNSPTSLQRSALFIRKSDWETRNCEAATSMKSVSSCLCAVQCFSSCIHTLTSMLIKVNLWQVKHLYLYRYYSPAATKGLEWEALQGRRVEGQKWYTGTPSIVDPPWLWL